MSDDGSVYDEAELEALEAEVCGEYYSQSRRHREVNFDTMLGGARSSFAATKTAYRAEQESEMKPRHIGRDDRATSEQVMDPRTRLILFKLLGSNQLASIDGCVSTGKEANVYFAKRGPNLVSIDPSIQSLAVKVYKTSVLVFRDRERYVTGEHRFQKGYSRSKNPRKMVKLWAEKELRNYKRLEKHNIPAPRTILVRDNVLLMEFLGNEQGWPSPRLKDADLSRRKLREAYWQICKIMHTMFHDCNLVHGDLSEYNLLWHNHRLIVIDVSQSVESHHPMALDFLRSDCKNITDFFGDKGRHTDLEPLSVRDLFHFITVPRHHTVNIDDILEEYMLNKEKTTHPNDDAVFMETYLPRSLYEIGLSSIACEREQRALKLGGRGDAYEQAVATMLKDETTLFDDETLSSHSDNDETNLSSEHTEEEKEEDFGLTISAAGRLPNDPEARALAKDKKKIAAKAAKEARAEKRKTKIKKHIKKRATSSSKSNSRSASSGR